MSHWPKNLVQGHFTPFTHRHNERNEQERTKGKESVVLTRIFLGVLIYDPFSLCSPFIQRFSAGEVWNRLGEREKIYMILTRILNIGLLWHQPLTQKLVQCHCTPFTLSGWSMSKIGLIGHKIQICDVGQMDNYAMLTEQCLNNYGRSFNYTIWLVVLKVNKICNY